MPRIDASPAYPDHPTVFYESDLGPNMLMEAQANFFDEQVDGLKIISYIDQVETFDGDKETAGQLLEKFHEGAMMVAHAVPNIVRPTPLWISFGFAPSPYFTIPAGHNVDPAVVITTDPLEYLSKLPMEETIQPMPGVAQDSFEDLGYTPEELMLAAGAEEAHHAIIARFMDMKYGVGIGQVSPDKGNLYLAQEVEWQAAQFVLEALKVRGVSEKAVAAHQRRMDAAEEVRKILGMYNYITMPFLKEFKTYHKNIQE